MDLYREEILDHYRHPRNKHKLSDADQVIKETNASCGDEATIYLKFRQDGTIEKVAFEGDGCSISMATLSMLTEVLPTLTKDKLQTFDLDSIYTLLGGPVNPGRVKCASLGLRSLEKALKHNLNK